jgi:hypothetical protein
MRPLPTAGGPEAVGRLGGGRRPSMPRRMEKVLARRRAPTRIQVLIGRAETPAPPRRRMLTLSRVLLAGPAITRFAAPPGPSVPASAATPVPMARVVARLERIALTSTIRVERSGPPGLPGIPPPGVPGPRGEAGGRGSGGVPGPAPNRRPALVVRTNPSPVAAPGRREHPPTATADAFPAVRPADRPESVPSAMPSIDEITIQVIRHIERRATAQRERLARPPRR